MGRAGRARGEDFPDGFAAAPDFPLAVGQLLSENSTTRRDPPPAASR